MPKQPITVELEAVNREGETQVVRDSGLNVQGYSIYLRVEETSGDHLATWVFDSDHLAPAHELSERLSLALAIPLTVLVPDDLMPDKEPATPTEATTLPH